MEPSEPDVRPPNQLRRVVAVAISVGVAALLLAVVVRRWRRLVGRDIADLTGEGVVLLTDAIVEELLAG
jgi:hypothetical protein